MRANRIDANQTEIIKHFEIKGCSVLNISSMKNCCDLIVSKHGISVFVEVKDGSRIPSQRKLTEGEIKFRDSTKGVWRLVESVEHANYLISELNSTIKMPLRWDY